VTHNVATFPNRQLGTDTFIGKVGAASLPMAAGYAAL